MENSFECARIPQNVAGNVEVVRNFEKKENEKLVVKVLLVLRKFVEFAECPCFVRIVLVQYQERFFWGGNRRIVKKRNLSETRFEFV